ncbi:hypothetical protein [Streptomyces sp. NPDC006879]|uniref:hypothetical protein n=1 Tax=Streptomyces sp. NPDC006879 TaxID=3364767 RepID=UPI0036D1AE1F
MQRTSPTRTTTQLLLGVACAVSAVSGCVQVTPAAGRLPAAAEPAPTAASDGKTQTLVTVRAPALEALEAAPVATPGATPPPASPAPARTGTAKAAQATGAGSWASGGTSRQAPRSGQSGQREQDDPQTAPPLVPRAPARLADVCALGRHYGGWRPDSAEARICDGVAAHEPGVHGPQRGER